MEFDFKWYFETNPKLIELQYREDLTEEEQKECQILCNQIRAFNQRLIDVYPFLLPYNRWTDAIAEDYDFSYTEMDAFPEGWAIAFGNDMLKEIKAELVKFNFLDTYRIMQIKEKYGGLRWYDNGTPIGKLSDIDETIKLDDYNFPQHTHNTDYWFFECKDKDGKYIFSHRKILDECKVHKIINKYENISYNTCIKCGKPAKYSTRGWVSPYCETCANSIIHDIQEKHPEVKFEDEFFELD